MTIDPACQVPRTPEPQAIPFDATSANRRPTVTQWPAAATEDPDTAYLERAEQGIAPLGCATLWRAIRLADIWVRAVASLGEFTLRPIGVDADVAASAH
ncbi:hypothetical protein ABTY96_07420 [Streptomyces sp. NPDC096057]|uniref:hypothetical protein n=1 Tax=Streptomyces sp. NPDC096057 TaxID=3155543 RepID=UPI003316B7BE